MLHQHGHHHIDEHELGGEHEGDKVHGRDKLQGGVAAVVHVSAVVWRTLPQRVLRGDGGGGQEKRKEEAKCHSCGSDTEGARVSFLLKVTDFEGFTMVCD